jgi:hypothetical protein
MVNLKKSIEVQQREIEIIQQLIVKEMAKKKPNKALIKKYNQANLQKLKEFFC